MERSIEKLIESGRRAFELRDYRSALRDLEQVLQVHPDFADIRHLTGLCLSFLGEPERAVAEFDRALAINDRYVEAHLNRAITLNELGRFEEAQAAFARAAQYESSGGGRFPGTVSARLANAHAEVGDLYAAAGAFGEAAEQYRLAIGIRPGFLDIRRRLASALIQLGDLDGAESELRTALEGNPRYLDARLELGLVHYRRDDRDAAVQEWNVCKEQSPDHPQVNAYLALLQRGQPGGSQSSEEV